MPEPTKTTLELITECFREGGTNSAFENIDPINHVYYACPFQQSAVSYCKACEKREFKADFGMQYEVIFACKIAEDYFKLSKVIKVDEK